MPHVGHQRLEVVRRQGGRHHTGDHTGVVHHCTGYRDSPDAQRRSVGHRHCQHVFTGGHGRDGLHKVITLIEHLPDQFGSVGQLATPLRIEHHKGPRAGHHFFNPFEVLHGERGVVIATAPAVQAVAHGAQSRICRCHLHSQHLIGHARERLQTDAFIRDDGLAHPHLGIGQHTGHSQQHG